jgi:putative peptidoglycan lipid II flippase
MHSFLKNSVFSISFGTSLSKLAGCIRQIFIAAAFGVGITYDAFNYAYIIPGFLLIIVGGINGPLHNAVVAVLTPLNKKKWRDCSNSSKHKTFNNIIRFCYIDLLEFQSVN